MAEAAAKLGFQVVTDDLEKGRVALDKITESAGRTETATSQMSRAMTNAGKVFSAAALGMTRSIESLVYTMSQNKQWRDAATQARRFSESVYEAASAQEVLASSVEKTTKAIANQNRQMRKSGQTAETKGTNRFYTGNIVAQFQDIGVTAAMGMNPLTVAIQQGTQLSAILESMERPLVGIAEGFKALISPVTLLTVGLTALSVVGLQMVDWASVGQTALNGFANSLDFVADHTTALAGALGLLGLATLPSILNTMTVSFTALGAAIAFASKAAAAFVGSKLLMLLYGLTSPLALVTVGVLAANEAFQTWVVGLSAFEATVNTVKLAINTLVGSIAAASAAVTSFYNFLFRKGNSLDVGASIKAAFNADYVEQFAEKLRGAANAVRNYGKATEEVKNPWESLEKYTRNTIASIELETKLLHAEGIEAERLRYQFELKNRAIESGLDITQKDVVARLSVMTAELTAAKKAFLTDQETKSYEDFIAGTRKSVDVLRDQERQLFMTSEELATYKAKMDLVNQATSKGITLSADRMKTIDNLAVGIGRQKADYDKLSSSISTATSLTSGFFIDMKNGLAQGQSAWKAFGTAVTNVLNNIADALIQFATQRAVLGIAANMMTPVGVEAGKAGGTGVGSNLKINSSVAAAGRVGGTFAKGGVFTNQVVSSPTVFKFAKGSRFGVMGEAGPEAVMPLTRSADGSLGVRSVGKSQETVVVNVINNSNATARTEERQTTHGKEIDVIIDQLVSQKINQQGSSTNRALTAYSNQKLISR